MELRHAALALLQIDDPAGKSAAVRGLWAQGDWTIDASAALPEPPALPGRPARPLLVPPKDVPARSPFTLEGRAALLHAIAHIEFNAIK